MGHEEIHARIAGWSCRFHDREMSVDDVHEAFAALTDDDIAGLVPELQAAVTEARQELEAFRFGMCEAGQAGEITRILHHLTSLATGPRQF